MNKITVNSYALKLLKARDYCSYALRIKLLKKYSKEDINKCIKELISLDLINDSRYLIEYIESSLNKYKGFIYIRSKLINMGYKRVIVDKSLSFYKEFEIIKSRDLINKYKDLSKDKLMLKLRYKGYSEDIIYRIYYDII